MRLGDAFDDGQAEAEADAGLAIMKAIGPALESSRESGNSFGLECVPTMCNFSCTEPSGHRPAAGPVSWTCLSAGDAKGRTGRVRHGSGENVGILTR